MNQLSQWVPGLSIQLKHIQQLTSISSVFPKDVSGDLETEFENLKKVLQKKASLSPIDCSYPVELWTWEADAKSHFSQRVAQ